MQEQYPPAKRAPDAAVDSFSDEKIEELKKESDDKNIKLGELRNSSRKDLWIKDFADLIRRKRAAKRAPDAAGSKKAKKEIM